MSQRETIQAVQQKATKGVATAVISICLSAETFFQVAAILATLMIDSVSSTFVMNLQLVTECRWRSRARKSMVNRSRFAVTNRSVQNCVDLCRIPCAVRTKPLLLSLLGLKADLYRCLSLLHETVICMESYCIGQ